MTPEEHERLAVLSEELGEVQQIIGKILRHGYDSYNPNETSVRTNREKLEIELGDIMCAIDLMGDENSDIDLIKIDRQRTKKREKLNKWLHHNKFND